MSFALLCCLPALLSVATNGALYTVGRIMRRRWPTCEPEDPPPFVSSAVAFACECTATLATVALAPLAWRRTVVNRPGIRPERIVLVPGLSVSRGGCWLLARRLWRRGYEVTLLSGPSAGADVPAAAAALRDALATLQRAQPGTTHLVAYGTGGLAARYCLRRYPVPGVRRIVTIGTPHLGTRIAPRRCRRSACLHPESPLLARLNTADHLPEQFEATAIYSTFDACIVPPVNGYYPRAFNIQVQLLGHTALLFSRRIVDLVVENLAA